MAWVQQEDEGLQQADQEAATQARDPLDMETSQSESESEETSQSERLP